MIFPYIGNNKCMVLLDDYSAHKTESVIDFCNRQNIGPFLICGGFTYCLQPLDVSINKPFKDALRRNWKNWNELSKNYTQNRNKTKPSWQQTISVVDRSTKELL